MFSKNEKFLDSIGIQKTARILPHDNDSGGFYVAVIKKLKNIKKEHFPKNDGKQSKSLYKSKMERYEQINKEDLESIKQVFNLDEKFPFHLLVNPVNSEKRVNIVS